MAPLTLGAVGTFGERLKEARLRAGFGVRSLARTANVSHGQISRLEGGTRGERVEAETVRKLADALGVSFDWLMSGEESSQGDPAPDTRIEAWIRKGDLPTWVASAARWSAGGFGSYSDQELWNYCIGIVKAAERPAMPPLEDDEKPVRRRK